jgi:hypothetical protein
VEARHLAVLKGRAPEVRDHAAEFEIVLKDDTLPKALPIRCIKH